VVEIALAVGTSPRDWWDEDDETLATALDVLQQRDAEVRKATRG
jgi:hypothetical protein